jgi:hypothetical protein
MFLWNMLATDDVLPPDVPPEQFRINVPLEHLVGRKKGNCQSHVPSEHLVGRNCQSDVPLEQFQINVPSEHLVGSSRKKGNCQSHVPSEHLVGRNCQSDVPLEQFQINVPSEHLVGRKKRELPIPCSIGTFGGKIFLLYLNNKLSRLTITFAAAHF